MFMASGRVNGANILKRRTTVGFRRAVGQLIEEFRIMRRHRAGAAALRRHRLSGDTRVQLGSGYQPKPGWINIDLFNPNADFALDVREDLPLSDDTVAFVYTEHLFEHLEYPRDAKHLLTEIRRVLKSGGVVSIVVPHCGEALHAYVDGEIAFFEPAHPVSYLKTEKPTAMHMVNYWFRQDGHHLYAYDEETLAQTLRGTGFVDVHAREFNPDLDSQRRHGMHSLYMEGTKPR